MKRVLDHPRIDKVSIIYVVTYTCTCGTEDLIQIRQEAASGNNTGCCGVSVWAYLQEDGSIILEEEKL